MGAYSLITLPVTVGLGGSLAVALNALAPVPMTGGGEHFCAQGLPARRYFRNRRLQAIEPLTVCSTLLSYSRLWSTPCPRTTHGFGDPLLILDRRA